MFIADFGGNFLGQGFFLQLQLFPDGFVDGFFLLCLRLLQLLSLLLEFFRFAAEYFPLLLELRLEILLQLMLDLVVEHIDDVKFVAAFGTLDGSVGVGH